MGNDKKNILLIMPKFFDYPEIISNELEAMGYNVDFFDDRPSTSGIVKAVIRVKKELIKYQINKYFKSIIEKTQDKKYEYILLISGQSLSFSKEMMSELKKAHNEAVFVLYQWDSASNFRYIYEMHEYFDKKYSFDRSDCEKNKELRFMPLFYSNKYKKIGEEPIEEYKYDFCFVGTAHPKKYKFVNEMTAQLSQKFKSMFIYFFFPSKIVYYYRKLLNPEFKNAKINDFHFVSLKGHEMDDIIRNSMCILDSAQDFQNGLTIRVIEALGAKRKIITTNKDVVNYDFYRKENIYVYEGSFDFDSEFFKSKYHELPEDIYEKYSVRSWLKELLS